MYLYILRTQASNVSSVTQNSVAISSFCLLGTPNLRPLQAKAIKPTCLSCYLCFLPSSDHPLLVATAVMRLAKSSNPASSLLLTC